MRADVVVVGAGLAGLRCAQVLAAAGRDVVVLEAVGPGRRPDPHRPRRRVPRRPRLPAAQPRLPRRTPLGGRRRPRPPAVRGRRRGAHRDRPRACSATRCASPRLIPSTLRAVGPSTAGGRRARALGRAAAATATRDATLSDVLERRADVDRRTALDGAGVDGLLRRVVDRFFAGVLLEDDGSTADRFALLLTWMFVRGRPGAARGRAWRPCPAQLAATPRRPGAPRPARCAAVTGTSVEHRRRHLDGRATSSSPPVRRRPPGSTGVSGPGDQGRRHRCGGPPPRRPTPTCSTSTPGATPTGPLVNAAVVSRAAPSYAPPGRHLVQGSALMGPRPRHRRAVDATPRRRPARRRPGRLGGGGPPRGAATRCPPSRRPTTPTPSGAASATSSSAATTATPAPSRVRSSAASAPPRRPAVTTPTWWSSAPACRASPARASSGRPGIGRTRPRPRSRAGRPDGARAAVGPSRRPGCVLPHRDRPRVRRRRRRLGRARARPRVDRHVHGAGRRRAGQQDRAGALGSARTACGRWSRTSPPTWRRATGGRERWRSSTRTPSSSPCPTRRPAGSCGDHPVGDVLRPRVGAGHRARRPLGRPHVGRRQPDRSLRRGLRQRRPRRRLDRRRRPAPRRRRPGAGRPLDARAGRAPPRRPGRRRTRGAAGRPAAARRRRAAGRPRPPLDLRPSDGSARGALRPRRRRAPRRACAATGGARRPRSRPPGSPAYAWGVRSPRGSA